MNLLLKTEVHGDKLNEFYYPPQERSELFYFEENG